MPSRPSSPAVDADSSGAQGTSRQSASSRASRSNARPQGWGDDLDNLADAVFRAQKTLAKLDDTQRYPSREDKLGAIAEDLDRLGARGYVLIAEDRTQAVEQVGAFLELMADQSTRDAVHLSLPVTHRIALAYMWHEVQNLRAARERLEAESTAQEGTETATGSLV